MSDQRDAVMAQLYRALVDITPSRPPVNAPCHNGIVPQADCYYCRRVIRAHEAMAAAKTVCGEVQ